MAALNRLLTLCALSAAGAAVIDASEMELSKSVHSRVEPGTWTDFYLTTSHGEGNHGLVFEVEAETSSPTGVGVYLFDSGAREANAVGVPILPNGQEAVHAQQPPSSAAALDVDAISHIGNSTHRNFFVYVGACYLMPGAAYVLAVYGAGPAAVPFTVTAKAVEATIPLEESMVASTVRGSVCDGKFQHHYFEQLTMPASGGVEIEARKTSGELDSFDVRYEQCAGPSGASLSHSELSGHGLSSHSVRLPTATQALTPGRYYISVRGTVELCGEYQITVRKLTAAEFSASSS